MEQKSEQLLKWFNQYKLMKEKGTLYSKDSYLPGALITMYSQSPSKINFDKIYNSFKDKYIYNENKLENVHEENERIGLGVVYDYIQSNGWKNFNSIFIILYIHGLLYSKIPFPEYGGKIRNVSVAITNSDVTTTPPENISTELALLDVEYKSIIEMAKKINSANDTFSIVDYINKCIRLKTSLIKIHPFLDGNGRSGRALLNIMFRMINLPPVYVTKNEKEEYIKAMDEAIRLDDCTSINKFYLYKICDSILELDIDNNLDDEKRL